MIRRYCQRGWMGLRGALFCFGCFKVRSTLARLRGSISTDCHFPTSKRLGLAQIGTKGTRYLQSTGTRYEATYF
jgi:hypothetical protein